MPLTIARSFREDGMFPLGVDKNWVWVSPLNRCCGKCGAALQRFVVETLNLVVSVKHCRIMEYENNRIIIFVIGEFCVWAGCAARQSSSDNPLYWLFCESVW